MNAIKKDERASQTMPAVDPKAGCLGETRVVGGVVVPDTPLISSAIKYARENSEPYLFNHVMRSWLFAVNLAQLNGTAHDGEVLAVATLLHDIGLAEAFDGPLRFEVEGANAARKFGRSVGLDERRCQLIWDGVALNSTPSIALYKEAEVALSTVDIGLDWGGWGYDSLPRTLIAEIVAEFPRLEMKKRFAHAVCRIVETRPASTYDNFARDFGERFVPGYKRPSVVDFLAGSPFGE
ncbi:MAG: HD domain-containing protein [Steroidobacteraceae bacterium]